MSTLEFSQLLGNYGEFVGAIAIVVTLMFLAVQVRHSWKAMEENSRLVRAAVFETTFTRFSLFRRHIIDSADVARIWREGCADHDLNEDDHTRFEHLGEEFIYGLNASFSQAIAAGNELLSRVLPPVLAASVCNDPGMRTMWEHHRSNLTASGFAGAVNTAVDGLTAQRQETQL